MSGQSGHWNYRVVSIPGVWYREPERFVATLAGWLKMTRARYGDTCELNLSKACEHYGAELHHTGEHGRGMNGSKRDDRETAWTCRPCHEIAEEQRRSAK